MLFYKGPGPHSWETVNFIPGPRRTLALKQRERGSRIRENWRISQNYAAYFTWGKANWQESEPDIGTTHGLWEYPTNMGLSLLDRGTKTVQCASNLSHFCGVVWFWWEKYSSLSDFGAHLNLLENCIFPNALGFDRPTLITFIVCKVDVKKYTALLWVKECFTANWATVDRNLSLVTWLV